MIKFLLFNAIWKMIPATNYHSTPEARNPRTIVGYIMAYQKPLLRVAAEEWIPYANIHKLDDGTLEISGTMAKFLDILASAVGFNYEIMKPVDSLWGSPFPNGSFSGMMGMLQREEVELALGPFFATLEREEVCDFSVQLYGDYYALFMIRPTLSSDIAGFIKPFTPLVWLLFLCSAMSIGLAMSFSVWIETWIFVDHLENIITRSMTWVIQTLSQEGSEWLPKHDGGRVIVVTWLLASLVFMSSYGGILTALLTVPKVDIPIDSLSDLLGQSKLPWRVEEGTMMEQYLQESEDEIKRQVYAKKAGSYVSCWRSRQEIADGEFVGICDHTNMKKIMSWDFSTTGGCHLYISKEIVYSGGILAIAFKTNSTYLPAANRVILSLKESGIADKWLNEQMPNATVCLRPPSADRSDGILPLGMESMAGTFIILLIGWCFASCTFFVEFVKYIK